MTKTQQKQFGKEQVNNIVAQLEELRKESQHPHPAQEVLENIRNVLQRYNWKSAEKIGEEVLALKDDILANCSNENRFNEIARPLEDLPVQWGGLAQYEPLFFILSYDVGSAYWTPCYNGEINPKNGWLMAGIRLEDGSTEAIPVRPGYWAHANADGLPSICMEM